MSEGLATTLAVLQKTRNEAAVRLLVNALDSPDHAIRDGALKALLVRRNRAGHREILRRLPRMPARWRAIVRQHHSRLAGALRDALLGVDPQACLTACEAAVSFREYDLIPTLLSALDNRSHEPIDAVASTVPKLALTLYEELVAPRGHSVRRDPQTVRQYILVSLEKAVARYPKHQRREVLEAFLLLAGRENAALKRILTNPHHPVFLPIIELLTQDTSEGVVRLLISFLDEPHPPSAVLGVIARRSDLDFVPRLLCRLATEPSQVVAQNLRKIRSVAWLQGCVVLLGQLDGATQRGMVRLAMSSGIPRLHAFTTIQQVLSHGKPEGRRAAAAALAEFNGADANALAVRALEDPDPQVQAAIVRQLRRRGIPGVLTRLVQLLESPHAEVRRAARGNLSEFTIRRFLAAFDLLNEDVQATTALLVKKTDSRAIPELRKELQSNIRSRRRRGLSVVRSMDLVESLEDVIVGLIDDTDHLIRGEAAEALAKCTSPASLKALKGAQFDSSGTVREAAARSLQERDEPGNRRKALTEPRN